MAYRPTAKTRANAQARRAEVERATRLVISRGGFAQASITAIAAEAGCSAGLVYTYFSNRDELLRRVFAQAAGHELAQVAAAVDAAKDVPAVVRAVAEVFVRRAVAGRRLAHALLLEPVPELVQSERMSLRRGYVRAIAGALVRCGWGGVTGTGERSEPCAEVVAGRLGPSAEVVARSIVGALSENLVDALDPAAPAPDAGQIDALIADVTHVITAPLSVPSTHTAFPPEAVARATADSQGEP